MHAKLCATITGLSKIFLHISFILRKQYFAYVSWGPFNSSHRTDLRNLLTRKGVLQSPFSFF